MSADPQPFDLYGPLPGPGTTVLEASAGTGKTFTIAALATRFVAEGVPLPEILAVTFTRMATSELRDRVREELVRAEQGLERITRAGASPPPEDRLLGLFAQGVAGQIGARRSKLAGALADFDDATITTTHGFCQMVLASLGVLGDVPPGATLLEDPSDLIGEVVDDLYVRESRRDGGLPFTRKAALRVVQTAVGNPGTSLHPIADASAAGLLRALADDARKEVARRLQGSKLLTYDDLLVRMRDSLADRGRGPAACARLRGRYQVALVDEFQDTDPVQWEVVRRAFGGGKTILVLIGDPKQAIYAFRGADVYAYLDAAGSADKHTLTENWRADKALIEAYDALLSPLRLGHADIEYRKVTAAPAHEKPGLAGAPIGAPLRARVLSELDPRVTLTSKQRLIQKDSAAQLVADDVAAEAAALLRARPEIVSWREDGSERCRRPLDAWDVAVLVRTNRQAGIVHEALRSAGVPAVVAGTESVLSTRAAYDWLCLLEALEQPASRSRAASAALTPFMGMTAEDVAGADEDEWERIHARLHRWADTLRRDGVATLAGTLRAAQGLPRRLLALRGGERQLTDLAHVAELLHAEDSRNLLGPPALRAWLARRVAESDHEGVAAEERIRRLDSDADAVRVLTVHRAKGLEFPVVYCPFLWDAAQAPRRGDPVVYHDLSYGNARKVDVGGDPSAPDFPQHQRTAREEQRGEELRLLYVALTRARQQAVVWWASTSGSKDSPLGRLLMCRDGDGTVAADGAYDPRGEQVMRKIEELARPVPERISAELCVARGPIPPVASAATPPAELRVRRLGRPLDLRWRRSSYSGITAAAHDATIGSEPEEPGIRDEPVPAGEGDGAAPPGSSGGTAGTVEGRLRATPSLLATMSRGPRAGTLVHRVLERVDFTAEDLSGELEAAVNDEQSRRALALGDPHTVARGLAAAIETPLGDLADGASLRDVARPDRLDELEFELPVAGGDRPAGEVSISDIRRVITAHSGSSDPLAGYADRLSDPLLAGNVRGFLTGSLDLVFRLTTGSAPPRYFVVDYKTNWLAVGGEPLSAWHYRPDALGEEMKRAHYPLQALLYTVALHRYLRWRLPGYSPSQSLGGALYLFLRGMTGRETPAVDGRRCGVFSWQVPALLVTGLSDLLDTGQLVDQP